MYTYYTTCTCTLRITATHKDKAIITATWCVSALYATYENTHVFTEQLSYKRQRRIAVAQFAIRAVATSLSLPGQLTSSSRQSLTPSHCKFRVIHSNAHVDWPAQSTRKTRASEKLSTVYKKHAHVKSSGQSTSKHIKNCASCMHTVDTSV